MIIFLRATVFSWFSLLLRMLVVHPPTVATANMNGAPGQYKIANSETYVTDYDNIEYFDAYSEPIETLYSQVHWRAHKNVKLPDPIVERFENKVMAVTGYEVDQVQTIDENETPVPITWAYNHHYGAFLLNSRTTKLVQKQVTPEMARLGLNHGPTHLVAEFHAADTADADAKTFAFPQVHFFSEGNGGEMRLSYHGYPQGYAQLIDSPDTFQVTPMQIDTWNRETMTNATFVPGGQLPSSSRIPVNGTAGYSRLVECPCSNRLEKKWGMSYKLLQWYKNNTLTETPTTTTATTAISSSCSTPVQNATECFAAAKIVVAASHYTNRIIVSSHQQDNVNNIDNTIFPPGCSIRVHRNGSTLVVWNNAGKQQHEDLLLTQEEEAGEAYYSKDDDNNNNNTSTVAFAAGQFNLTVTLNSREVQMTLVGPALHDGDDDDGDDVWFAVGFGTDSMCLKPQADECPSGGPYVIVVQGDVVTERKLDYHGPGIILNSTITVQSNTVTGGSGFSDAGSRRRTVVLTRSLQGASEKYYTFDYSSQTAAAATAIMVPIIMAKGCGLEFAQHCGHGSSQLNFLHVNQPTSICQAGIQAFIDGSAFALNRCAPFPTSDLLNQHNPTCSIQSYRGGLSCCRDGKSLLDKEQEQPWPDVYLKYRLKFRFYFDEYQHTTPVPSHQSLVRLYWQTESFAGEYDISPACPPDTPPSHCVQVITSQWKVRDMMRDCVMKDASWCTGKGSTDSNVTAGVQLIYAAPHCHAPTCLSMELYNADTGQLICHVEPIYGKNSSSPYEEEKFLAIPPCLWGDEAQGLLAPKLLSLDTTLLSIKRNNNTLPHTGEMASWQMRGVVVPHEKKIAAASSRRFDHATAHDVDDDDDETTATQVRRIVNAK